MGAKTKEKQSSSNFSILAKFKKPGKLYAILVLLFVAVLIIIWLQFYSNKKMITSYLPIMQMLMNIQTEVDAARLWSEEIVSGKSNRNPEEHVIKRLEKAASFCRIILDKQNIHMLQVEDSELRILVLDVHEDLKTLSSLAAIRLNDPIRGDTGTDLDQKFDLIYNNLSNSRAHMEEKLKALISRELKNQDASEFVLVFLVLSLLILLIFILNKYENYKSDLLCRLGTNLVNVQESRRELQEERDFADSLISTVQTIILVLDQEGRILRFNKYLEEISGYSLDEVQGLSWFRTFLPDQDHERIETIFKKALGEERTRGNVNSIITKSGDIIEIEWYDTVLKSDDGEVIGLLACGHDVTERNRLEDSQRKLAYETKERIKELRCMYGVARSINSDRSMRDILQDVVEIIPKGWRYPELCSCRITLDTMIFSSSEYTGTGPVQSADIFIGGEKCGMVEVCYSDVLTASDEKPFLDEESLLINGVSRALGKVVEAKIAREKIQMLSSELTLAEEKQRRYLASLLHDGTCQSLAVLKAQMMLLSRKIGEEEIKNELDKSIGLMDKTIKETRTLLFDLSPPILYELGLVEALSWLFDRYQKKLGLPTMLKCNVEKLDLPEDHSVLIFHIVRELLNNAEKYAKATELSGSLSLHEDKLIIQVIDDGIGFDKDSINIEAIDGGFGLLNISERLRIFGGLLIIDSEKGAGTDITIEFPTGSKVVHGGWDEYQNYSC